MNDSSNICLACGLCCDGTLIGFVQLDPQELPDLRALLDIEGTNENGVIIQPCSKYCDGCTIYADRPKQCASFKCGLLNSVEQEELEFDSAVETINKVKAQKIAIEKKIALIPYALKSKSFYFKIVELKKLLEKKKSESSLLQNDLELTSNLKQLDHLLSERFGITMD